MTSDLHVVSLSSAPHEAPYEELDSLGELKRIALLRQLSCELEDTESSLKRARAQIRSLVKVLQGMGIDDVNLVKLLNDACESIHEEEEVSWSKCVGDASWPRYNEQPMKLDYAQVEKNPSWYLMFLMNEQGVKSLNQDFLDLEQLREAFDGTMVDNKQTRNKALLASLNCSSLHLQPRDQFCTPLSSPVLAAQEYENPENLSTSEESTLNMSQKLDPTTSLNRHECPDPKWTLPQKGGIRKALILDPYTTRPKQLTTLPMTSSFSEIDSTFTSRPEYSRGVPESIVSDEDSSSFSSTSTELPGASATKRRSSAAVSLNALLEKNVQGHHRSRTTSNKADILSSSQVPRDVPKSGPLVGESSIAPKTRNTLTAATGVPDIKSVFALGFDPSTDDQALNPILSQGAPGSVQAVVPSTPIRTGADGYLTFLNANEMPIIDRFGFVYDVKSSMKLIRAAQSRRDAQAESALYEDMAALTGNPGHEAIKRLLTQLDEESSREERALVEKWDQFLKRKLPDNVSSAETMVEYSKESGNFGLHSLFDAKKYRASRKTKQDWHRFLTLVRQGVPMIYRSEIWLEISGAHETRESDLYGQLIASDSLEKADESSLIQIERDCHRTFPANIFFAGQGPGVEKLRRVLIAYSLYNPAVGYCQGMNNLASTLLLSFNDEEDAFWVLHCIIDKLLPRGYFSDNLLEAQIDQFVVKDLVRIHIPKLYQHFIELDVELPAITLGWFLSLYTDVLPFQSVLRVWDLFLTFGSSVIFHTALSILKLASSDLLLCDSATSVYSHIRSLTASLYRSEALVKTCMSLRSLVRDSDIASLRCHHEGAFNT